MALQAKGMAGGVNRRVIRTQRSLAKGTESEEQNAENFNIEHFREADADAVRKIITEEATDEDPASLASENPLRSKLRNALQAE